MNRMKAKMVSHRAQSIFFSIEIPNRATYTKHLCFPTQIKENNAKREGKKEETDGAVGRHVSNFFQIHLFIPYDVRRDRKAPFMTTEIQNKAQFKQTQPQDDSRMRPDKAQDDTKELPMASRCFRRAPRGQHCGCKGAQEGAQITQERPR
jgi:hypothetical protein